MDSFFLNKRYRAANRKKNFLIILAALLVVVLGIWFASIGLDQTVWRTILALKAYSKGSLDQGPDSAVNKIILLLRLPRIAMAILAGVGLAVSGAIMQSVTRNPLVSPFTLGLSSAAAFGASMCIVFGEGVFFESETGVIACAFTSSLFCVFIVYSLAKKIGINPTVIVLVGISLNYFFSALTATVEFFAKQHKLEAIVHWTFGSFNKSSWNSVIICAVIITLCMLFLRRQRLRLDAIALNDDESVKSLGINPENIRAVSGIIAVLITSTIISFTGVIGFVGLIAPHMARMIIGNQHCYFIPFAGFLGAILLLCADTMGRFLLYPVSIPVGIIVSFLGAPLFARLILSVGKKGLN
ncbi:MAG: iron ABC transporter permease [Deltaproteobacteria bacterium]|jgi:iron complex transport system permease protein|nr:iron ABC transporter permease [Deltaproteobacteria bacterium]